MAMAMFQYALHPLSWCAYAPWVAAHRCSVDANPHAASRTEAEAEAEPHSLRHSAALSRTMVSCRRR